MRRKLIISAVVFMVVYCGSYTGLTLSGAYIPSAYDLRGVMGWIWAPPGFAYKDGRFPTTLGFVFIPLWWLDIHYWHNDESGQSGPRHEHL
jgi:hypothetical protein